MGLWEVTRSDDRSSAFRQLCDVHLVFDNGSPYPVNLLRNVALERSRTRYVVIVDVDLIPSKPTRQYLLSLLPSLQRKTVYVLAAFEAMQPNVSVPNVSCSALVGEPTC